MADQDRTAGSDSDSQALARLQAPGRKRTQLLALLLQAGLPACVEPDEQIAQKALIRLSVLEVPAAAKHQRLVQCPLKTIVALFHVPVLVWAGRPRCPAFQPIVVQQRLVILGKGLLTADPMNGRCQPVRLVRFRHASKLPERPLQTRAEALEALGKTDEPRLPVGIRQHEVVNQMVETRPSDRDTKVIHAGEIGLGQIPGMMHLREEDLPGLPFRGAPKLYAPLKGP